MNFRIDNLQYCNWSREVFEINRKAGLDAVHATVVYHEDFKEFCEKIKKWEGYKKIDVLDFFVCRSNLKPCINVKADKGMPTVDVTFVTKKENGVDQSFTADPTLVIEAWKNGQSMVPLKEGGWSHIPAEWLATYGERLLYLLQSKNKEGVLPKSMISDVADGMTDTETEKFQSLVDDVEFSDEEMRQQIVDIMYNTEKDFPSQFN